jgi:hypothetical protein
VKPADLVNIKTPDAPALAPDRRSVVLVLRGVDGYVRRLRRVRTNDTSAPVRRS